MPISNIFDSPSSRTELAITKQVSLIDLISNPKKPFDVNLYNAIYQSIDASYNAAISQTLMIGLTEIIIKIDEMIVVQEAILAKMPPMEEP